jgi:5-methylcytosine-specific restriction endonuclease McrA
VWRCAATDDHGTILGLGRATFTPNYRPPAATTRLVRLRDTECVFPGCRRQARYCDLDHRVPHRLGGATCDCNLQVLCGHHHRLKHEAGFEVTLDPDIADPDTPPGTLTWTTPTGRRIQRHPEPAVSATPAGRTDEPPF